MKKFIIGCMLTISVVCVGVSTPAYAVPNSLDEIVEQGSGNSATEFLEKNTNGNSSNSVSGSGGVSSSGSNSVSNALKGFKPVTDENMAESSRIANPIVGAIGNFIGIMLSITSAGIFGVTALDLAFIGIPFTRKMLTSPNQLVSDEALACVGMTGGQQGSTGGMNQGMGSMGGMNQGMGSMGGMGGMNQGMGSMGGMNQGMGGMQQGAQGGTKSVAFTYLKKRTIFIVLFGVCTVLLTSSIFFDCGINIAELISKVMLKANAGIPNAF